MVGLIISIKSKSITINPDSFEVPAREKSFVWVRKSFKSSTLPEIQRNFYKGTETVWGAPIYQVIIHWMRSWVIYERNARMGVPEYIETIWGLGVRLKGDDWWKDYLLYWWDFFWEWLLPRPLLFGCKSLSKADWRKASWKKVIGGLLLETNQNL